MVHSLKPQFSYRATLPLVESSVYTGSALSLVFRDVPEEYAGGTVSALTVTVTNADGQAVTGSAAKSTDDPTRWHILFAASNFPTYGEVEYGVKVVATVTDTDGSYPLTFIGDFTVKPGSASATQGDPTNAFIRKGDDMYLKTEVVDEVQHYTLASMVNHPQLGWAIQTSGDYILNASGEFVAA